MQTWLSYHFYPLESPDLFLTRAVRPFLEQHVWATKGARAFFIRYEDAQGPHIRLRLRGEADWLQETLLPALTSWFEGRGERKEVPYQAEPDRFGGEEALAWSEEHFHVSTRVVLDRLNREYTYGDALFDSLRLHVIAAFAAGFSREKAAIYFGQLYEQWLPLFFRPAEGSTADPQFLEHIKNGFAESWAAQQAALEPTLAELWVALKKGDIDVKQPEWLRWLRGNQLILKEFGKGLPKALPSLLHLTSNRLGVNNQDEVFVCYLLSQAL